MYYFLETGTHNEKVPAEVKPNCLLNVLFSTCFQFLGARFNLRVIIRCLSVKLHEGLSAMWIIDYIGNMFDEKKQTSVNTSVTDARYTITC